MRNDTNQGRSRCARRCLGLASWLLVAGLTAETLAVDVATPATIHDLRMTDGGAIHGQLVDDRGVPQAGVAIGLMNGKDQGNGWIARQRTDAAGRFAFKQVRGGLYVIATEQGDQQLYRVWTPAAAPPSAQPAALLVRTNATVRGQQPGAPAGGLGGIGRVLTNPFVVTAGVAAGMIAPLAELRSQIPAS